MTDETHHRLQCLRNEFAVRQLRLRGDAEELARLEEQHLEAEMGVLTDAYGADCSARVRAGQGGERD